MAIFGSVIAIAFAESVTPLHDEWLLYYIPLVSSFVVFQPILPIGIAIAATIAIVVVSAVSPARFDVWIEAINRGMGVFALWVTAILGYLFIRNKQAVLASKDRLQFALEAAHVGWWEYDPNQGTVSWDGRMRALFKVAEAQADVEEFKKRVHPDDVNRMGCRRGDPRSHRSEALRDRVPDSARHRRNALGRGPRIC